MNLLVKVNAWNQFDCRHGHAKWWDEEDLGTWVDTITIPGKVFLGTLDSPDIVRALVVRNRDGSIHSFPLGEVRATLPLDSRK